MALPKDKPTAHWPQWVSGTPGRLSWARARMRGTSAGRLGQEGSMELWSGHLTGVFGATCIVMGWPSVVCELVLGNVEDELRERVAAGNWFD